MKIYHCEDSLEGIFTAIYNTYEDHCIIRDTMVTTIEENLLFSESVEVIPDPEKTVKVIRTLKRRFGEEDYESLADEQFDVDYKGYNFKILSVVKKMIGSVLVRKLPEEKTPQNAEDGQSVLEEKENKCYDRKSVIA